MSRSGARARFPGTGREAAAGAAPGAAPGAEPEPRSGRGGGSGPGARSYHHGNLRAALLDSAFALLTDTPPGSLSLRAVARHAQVSHSAPYHYFADRTALLEALGTECMVRFVEAQEAAVAAAGSGIARLRAQGLAYVDFAADNPHAFQLIYDPAICTPGDPTPERAVQIERIETLLGSCVAAAQAEGMFAGADTAELAVGMWGTVHGLARLLIEGHLDRAAASAAITAVASGERS